MTRGGTTLIERLEFQVAAPKRALPGLDETHRKLVAIQGALRSLQGQIAGVSTRNVFKLSARQFEATLRNSALGRKKGAMSVSQVARMLGFPDLKDVKRVATAVQGELDREIAKIQRRIDQSMVRRSGRPVSSLSPTRLKALQNEIKALQSQSFFADPSARQFKHPRAAGQFFKHYSGPALKNIQRGEAALAAVLRGTTGGAAAPDMKALIDAIGKSTAAAPAARKPVPVTPAPPAGGAKPPLPPAASGLGALLGTQVDTRGESVKVRRRYLQQFGQELDQFWKDAEAAGTVTTTNHAKQARAKFNSALAGIKRELDADLARPENRAAARQAALRRGAAGAAEALAGRHEMVVTDPHATRRQQLTEELAQRRLALRHNATALRQAREEADRLAGRRGVTAARARVANVERVRASLEAARTATQGHLSALPAVPAGVKTWVPDPKLEALGLGAQGDKARGWAANQLRQSAKAGDAAQRQMVKDAQALFRTRQELDAARAKGDKAQEKLLRDQQRTMEKALRAHGVSMRDLNRMHTAGQTAQAAVTRVKQKAADTARKSAQAAAYKTATYQGAEYALNDFLATGGTIVKQKAPYKGAPAELTAQRSRSGQMETLRVTYGKAGATATHTTRQIKELRKETGLLTGDFVKNTLKVTAWAASVGVLYGTLGLLKNALTSTIDLGRQMRRLDQVFTGLGGSSRQLTDDVLGMASAYGRSADEAMEAAISWSRMGLSRAKVNEAVRVSLMAANVAELDAAQATEHLQAILRNYNLEVGQLATVLGQLNEISNTYNVTNKDMLEGMTRSAAVARQTGLGFQELIGMIGASVGATKQTGANIGTALKTIMLSLSNPELQGKLRTRYQFEVTTGGGDIKDMSRILGELFVRYQKLNQFERQSLLFDIAGKRQANRLVALLNNYVNAQTLAINAQLNLNSATEENEKILSSLRAQMTAVSTEWQRFVNVQANRGPMQAMTEITQAFKGLLTLMNSPAGSALTTGMMGLFAAASARSVIGAMRLRKGANRGFVGRTLAQGGALAGELSGYASRSMHGLVARHRARAGAGAWLGEPLYRSALFLNRMNQFGDRRLLAAAKAMQQLKLATAGFNAVLGATAKSLALATATLGEFLVPLLVIGAAIWGFNRGMEAMGLSTEGATKRLAGFNAAAERARSTADALGEAARLMDTALRALTPDRGVMASDAVTQMLDQLGSVAFIDEEDLAVRRQKTDGLREELKLLEAQGDRTAIQVKLDERRVALAQARRRWLQAEYEEIQKQQASDRADVAAKEKMQQGWKGRFFRDKRQTQIDELKGRIQERQGKSIQNVLEQQENVEDERSRQLETSEAHQTALEKQKLTLQAMADLYATIRTSNPLEAATVQMAGLTGQIQAAELLLRGVEARQQAAVQATASQDAAAQERRKQEQALRQQLMDVHELQGSTDVERDVRNYPALAAKSSQLGAEGWGELVTGSVDWQDKIHKLLAAEEASLQAQLENLARDATLKDAPATGLEQEAQALQERLKTLRSQRNAQQDTRALVRDQTLYGFGQDQAGRSHAAQGYGYDESDKLLRQQAALNARIKELGGKVNLTLRERGELTRSVNLAEETQLALLDRHYKIQADINQLVMDNNRELSRSLLGAGPAEMLRQLAAFRRSRQGGASQGEFYGMGAEFRQEYSRYAPQYDPNYQNLLRERDRSGRALGQAGMLGANGQVNADAVSERLLKFTDLLQNAVTGLNERLLQSVPTQALKNADLALTGLSTAADLATSALRGVAKLGNVIGALLDGWKPQGAGGQYGGQGGQTGFSK